MRMRVTTSTNRVRFLRYTLVSAFAALATFGSLAALVTVWGWAPLWANVVATAVGTLPSFEFNRRWVWHSTGRRSIRHQVAPFWALSFVGLLASSIAVAFAGYASVGSGEVVRTVAVEGANIFAGGLVWLVQYIVCERWLFARPETKSAIRPTTAVLGTFALLLAAFTAFLAPFAAWARRLIVPAARTQPALVVVEASQPRRARL
jgi:putative flippase GtrA